MKCEKKSSSQSELLGCCFGGIFLKKIHFSSQELVLPGEKQKLDDGLTTKDPTLEGTEPPPSCNENPPPYSLHANHDNYLWNTHENNKVMSDQLKVKQGNEQYIYDKDTDTTYLLGKLLGKGGFARCYEMIDTKTEKLFAGKIVSKVKLTRPRQKEKILHEISLHSSLHHCHVVDFHTSFEDENNVYIILEYCSKKSLVHVLKTRQRLTEAEVRYYAVQLLDGIRYIRSQNVIHRDLKLGNMLLNEGMHIKIADFGLATKIEFPGEKKMTVCGTPNYIAPEVLQKKGHGYEVDIWAVGCIMYALLCGRPPFETHSLKETYLRISTNRYHIPSYVSSAARRLISKLLHPDPESRPTLNQISTDDFFISFFTPRYLPTSCCDVEPKFGSKRIQGKKMELEVGKDGNGKSSKITEKNVQMQILQPNRTKKDQVKVPFEPDENLGQVNLREGIQRNHILCTTSSKQLSKSQNKKAVYKKSICTEVAGSLVPKHFERYCRSIKMLGVDKETNDNYGKKIIEFEQLDFLVIHPSGSKNNSEKSLLCDSFGISRFSAIRLYRALSHCLEIMPSDSSPTPVPYTLPLWVTKWVDYSNKYGFGFQLSDLSVGILFNDTTRMVLSSCGRSLTYNDLSNQTFVYSTNLAPKEHRKKVTLLLYFSQYMEEHLIHGADLPSICGTKETAYRVEQPKDHENVGSVFMRKWFRTDKAIVMHLSNGTLQVNFFDDHTKLILSVDEQDYLATYINDQRVSVCYRLLSITNFGCRNDIADRLKYARKMLEGVINLGGETV